MNLGGFPMRHSISKVYTRRYRDNGQTTCYVEWADGARTEGAAEDYHGVLVPVGAHMGALFDRALREGLTIGREVW
jgi:hypothetical protein